MLTEGTLAEIVLPKEVPSTWTARWRAHSTGSQGPQAVPQVGHPAAPIQHLQIRVSPVPEQVGSLGWLLQGNQQAARPGECAPPPGPCPGLCSLAGTPTASWAESSAGPALQPAVCSAAHRAALTGPLHPQLLVQETLGPAGDEGVQALHADLPTRLCL